MQERTVRPIPVLRPKSRTTCHRIRDIKDRMLVIDHVENIWQGHVDGMFLWSSRYCYGVMSFIQGYSEFR